MLNKKVEVFAVYIFSFSLESIYLDKKAQIAFLFIEKVIILDKYSDFANIFLEQQFQVLPKQTELNQYTIKLQNGKQLFYRSIYSLKLMELETLKISIKTNLGNSFIWPSKPSASALILFV